MKTTTLLKIEVESKIVICTELCMTKYISYMHTYKTALDQFVRRISFTKNDCDQSDIINKIKILTKQGTDMIHAVTATKY